MPTYPIPHNLISIPDPTPSSDPKFMGPKRNMYVDANGVVRSRPGVKATVAVGDDTGVVEGMTLRYQGTTEFLACTRVGTTVYWNAIGISKDPTALNLNRFLTTTVTAGNTLIRRPNMFTYGVGSAMWLGFPNATNINTYVSAGTETNYALSSAGFTPAWDPTRMGRAIFMNGLVVASEYSSSNTQTDVIRFSNVGDPFTWSAGDFLTAESTGDFVNGLEQVNGNLILFGPQNIEIREYDGESFPLVPGGTLDIGMTAESSTTKVDGSLFFVDSNKRLFLFDGRNAQQVPFQYSKHLIETVSTGVGGGIQCYTLYYRGKRFIFINDRYSSNTKCMVYDLDTGDSYEWDWGTSSTTGLNWSCVMSFPFISDETILAGSASSGTVGILSEDSHSGIAGTETMRKSITTGWIDHGTAKAKKSRELRIYVDRVATSGTYPVITVRYRNNGSDSYAASRTITPSASTYQYACYRLNALGHYRERQYQIYTDSAAPLRIGRIEEDVVLL